MYFYLHFRAQIFHFLITAAQSNTPRTTLCLTPTRSWQRPPRTNTVLCSCRLWPSPGTYAVTSLPLVRRTRTQRRLAEFGFLGFRMIVFSTTAFMKGRLSMWLCGGRFLTCGAVRAMWSTEPCRRTCRNNGAEERNTVVCFSVHVFCDGKTYSGNLSFEGRTESSWKFCSKLRRGNSLLVKAVSRERNWKDLWNVLKTFRLHVA